MSTTFQLAVWRLVLLMISDNTDRSWSTKMQTRPSPFHDASSYEGLPGRQSLPTSTMSGILSGRAMVYPEAERGQTGPDSLARWKRRPARGPRGGAPRRPGRSGWGPAHDAAQRARRLSAVLHRAWAHDEVPAVRDGEAVVEAADAGGADVEACAEEEVVLLVEHATDVGVGELFLVELGAALEEGCRGAKSRFLGQSVFCQTGGFVFCHVSLVVYRSWTGGKRGGAAETCWRFCDAGSPPHPRQLCQPCKRYPRDMVLSIQLL